MQCIVFFHNPMSLGIINLKSSHFSILYLLQNQFISLHLYKTNFQWNNEEERNKTICCNNEEQQRLQTKLRYISDSFLCSKAKNFGMPIRGSIAFHPRNIVRFYGSQNLSEPSSRMSLSYISQSSSEAYPVLQSNGFQHWFKDWQDLRSQKLTASTFGGAVGFWHGRRVQLWLEKLGFVKPFTRNLATCWNNIKEKEALERYLLISGNTFFVPNFQVYGEANAKEDWLAASPDGIVEEVEKKDGVVKTPSSLGVLEIKCPFFNGDMVQALPYKRIPLHYIPQAQGLMEIMDMDWMDFYVYTDNGSNLFRLYRDVEYWKILKVALSDFWWNHVQPARELCSKFVITDPLIQLRSFKPAPRHELCSLIVSKSKGIVDDSKLLTREIYGKLLN